MNPIRVWRRIGPLIALAVTASLIAGVPTTAGAAPTPPASPDQQLVVNTTVDGAGDCSDGNVGTCTLRAAIDAANAAAPAITTIEVPAGTYLLTDGPLTITADGLYLSGAFSPVSDAPTLIDANGAQGFLVDADAVTLAGIAVTNAVAPKKGGGAVFVERGTVGFLLSQSSLYGNGGEGGAGVQIDGSARIEQSTFSANAVVNKGGGIRVGNQGSLELDNSTFTNNAAQSGGAVSVAGTAEINFSTFLDNTSNNENGAGVDRNGGTVTITGSILTQSNQQNATGSDCSGNPDLVGVNFVGNAQGCNPGPDTIVSDSSDPTTVLVLGALADNGGPTETIALLDGSTGAIDRTPCTDIDGATVTVDQRDLGRPGGATCDLGAYELVPLDIEIALDVDVTNYTVAPNDVQDPDVPGPEVGVGVVSVPVENILPELLGRNEQNTGIGPEDTALNSIALNSIALNSIDPDSVALNSIDVDFLALNSIALNSIALNSIALNSIAANALALNSITLDEVPLLDPPGGWEAFLVGTAFEGFPIQLVSLQALSDDPGIDLEGIGIADLDLAQSALNSIALHSILLADVALNSIALNSIDAPSNEEAWCIFLGPELCDPADAAQVAALGDLSLLSLEFVEGVPEIPVFDIPVAAALNSIALNSIALNSIFVDHSALNSIALNSIALNSIALNSIFADTIALNSIALNSIALNSIDVPAALALNSIALNSIDVVALGVDCDNPDLDCSTDTFGDAVAAGAIDGSTPLGAILNAIDPAALATIPLGETLAAVDPVVLQTLIIGDLLDIIGPALGDLLLGDLLGIIDPTVLENFSLADLLVMFLAPSEIPFESIDLDGALLQNVADPPQPEFHYIATIDVIGGPADIDVTLNLPTGFAFATNPLAGSPATFMGAPVTPANDDLSMLEFGLTDVPSGTHQLVVAARAGMTLGTFSAFVMADAVAGTETDSAGPAEASVNVVEAFEDDGPGSTPALLAADGELQFAHMGRQDDIDLYSFTVPEHLVGASARALLSNIPAGVDYDVVGYVPPSEFLRGEPGTDLQSLGDIIVDLDPTDDAYAPDVVGDIPRTIPEDWLGVETAVRDVSSRRSNDDEEIRFQSLIPGATYYVQVAPFNGEFDDDPYAIRLRVDEPAPLPACAAGARQFPHPLPAAAVFDPATDVPAGVNTLFVTNTQWLEATLGPDDGDPLTNEADDVLTSIEAVADSGINGVVGALVPVDAFGSVQAAYNTWRNDRCDVDDRNAVVSTIGEVLDDITAAHPQVENIVIVGGDGVVPMAGLPDLTTIANERTFANEVLTPNGDGTYSSNELSSVLGASMLLSDDPYGVQRDPVTGICTGCIEVGQIGGEGDRELFMATFNLGRLVEDADEIVTSLDHFVQYDGKLDPGTLSSALVSGYDFLTDGAEDLRATLESGGVSVNTGLPAGTEPLIGDTWDRDDLLAGLSLPELDFVSPNAHYDFESLLPAEQDGTGSWELADLVSVADLAALPDDSTSDTINNPLRAAVVWTMGCHAGLSVDDLQVGFTATDFAETYADGNNVYGAHTTYGYGETELVAYSERLVERHGANLAAMAGGLLPDLSVGEAMRLAKAEYLATTLILDVFDEKILHSYTNFGMPMYVMDVEATASTLTASSLEADDGPIEFGPTVDGVTPVTIDVTVDGPEGSAVGNLNLNTSADGSWYDHAGDTLTAPYRPVEPAGEFALPSGVAPRSFLITELSSVDITPFDPLYFTPTIDLERSGPNVEADDPSFPANLSKLVSVETPSGVEHRLLWAFGQFQAGLENDGALGQDVQRLFTHVEGELLAPGPDLSDTIGPIFSRAIGRVSEQNAEDVAQFEIGVSDAARCRLLFRLPLASVWTGIDLSQVGLETWIGAAPVPGGTTQVEFFANCVDANNNASITVNKVDNYLADEVIEAGSLDIALSSPDGEQNGYFRGPVTATVTGLPTPQPEGYTIEYSIDSQPFVEGTVENDTVTIPAVSEPGGHVILVEDSEGNREFVFFVIDDAGPALTATPSIDTSGSWASQPVTVTLEADDVGQSGVASITYATETVAADGTVTTTGPTVVADDSVPIVVDAEGVTTISATAEDVAGNSGTLVPDEVVRVDQLAPTVGECTGPPSPNQWFADNQTITCEVTDDGSGFAGSATTTATLSTNVAGGVETDTAVAGDPSDPDRGPLTVTDDAGQSVDVGPIGPFWIDRKAPVITVNAPDPAVPLAIGEAASLDFTCTDDGSGVATCDGPTTIDTSQAGAVDVTITATDAVGNTATETVTYNVAYGICLLYDPLQERNAGSTIPIKLVLCDSDGNNLSSNQIELTAIGIDEFVPGVTPPPNDAGNSADDPNDFRFDPKEKIYIYNFTSDGIEPGFHELLFVVDDEFSIIYGAGFTISDG